MLTDAFGFSILLYPFFAFPVLSIVKWSSSRKQSPQAFAIREIGDTVTEQHLQSMKIQQTCN